MAMDAPFHAVPIESPAIAVILPLVSVILRCRDRRGLELSLHALGTQRHALLELILIEADGPLSLPPIAARLPTLRRIAAGVSCSPAAMANLGIAAARGDFLCILDPGWSFEPSHLEAMLAAAVAQPQALLLYAPTRHQSYAAGQAEVIGRRFNPALFFFDPQFDLQAALIRRRAIELGCRFDESLQAAADHDFMKQIAAHGEIVFVDRAAPVLHRQTALASDAAPSVEIAQRLHAACLDRAKWTGERLYHALRSTLVCARASALWQAGQRREAQAAFERILDAYPDDPEALHGLARCELEAGRVEAAWRHLLGALDLDPGNAAYRATAAELQHQRQAQGDSLITESPLSSPTLAWTAAAGTTPVVAVTALLALPSRTAPCRCGSGRRYKHCCGRPLDPVLPAPSLAASAHTAIVRRAETLLQAGEAEQATQLLRALSPQAIVSATLALDAGNALLQLHQLPQALAWLERAVTLDAAPAQLAAYEQACELALRPVAWRSANRTLKALVHRLNARAAARPPAPSRRIHVVCKLDTLGGTERRALSTYRWLAPHAEVRLWSTAPALAHYRDEAPIRQISATEAPDDGTLILIGTYFECGAWLEQAPFARIVICHNLAEQYPSLLERLIQIEENPSRPSVELIFPSRLFMDSVGIAGHVEYSLPDLLRFQPAPGSEAHNGLIVGRHGRADRRKFDPNDPSLWRRLQALGHRVRVLGGSVMASAFADDHGAVPALLPLGAETPEQFLGTLDVFLYRKHPAFFETGGTTILEAMAMALPVIVFAEQCGVAELIVNGENGFRVETEDEVIALLERLAADPELRQRIGAAARATIVALAQRQHAEVIARYLELDGLDHDREQLQLALR